MSNRYPHVKSERMRELDEMIAGGWGSVPQRLIPQNWRDVDPPATYSHWFEIEDEADMPERIENMRETGSGMDMNAVKAMA